MNSPGWRVKHAKAWTIGLFGVGTILGGTFTAFLAWVLSGFLTLAPASWRGALFVALAAIAILRDFKLIKLELPENKRLVPQEVFRFGPVLSSLQFGFEMGTGARTYVPSTAPYVVLAGILLSGLPFGIALLVGAAFGAARGLLPVLHYACQDPDLWENCVIARDRLVIRASSLLLCAGVVGLVYGT